MDFHELMHVAASKQQATMKKAKKNRYSLDLPAPKREEKSKAKSETVQKLIQEKEKEKQKREREQQENERRKIEERERQEKEEIARNKFRIPKKKSEPFALEKRQLIDSLFDDTGEDYPEQEGNTDTAKRKHSEMKAFSSHSSSSLPSNSSIHKISLKDSSPCAADKKASRLSSKECYSSNKSSSSSKHLNGSSSSSKHRSSHSSSKAHKGESSSHHHSSKNTSNNHQNLDIASAKTNKVSTSLNGSKDNSSYKNPIPLNKNHLNPIQERHAENPQLSEKAKILARLQAIKERTKAAIEMENEAKGKRVRGVKTQRKGKNEEVNEKAKSAEIVKDAISSDEESGNDMPSALDIMLSERNAKLEKEKIARLAKQAWERATKGEVDKSREDSKSHKVKKHMLEKRKDKSSSHMVKQDDKISPFSESSASKQEAQKQKKPVIVRHANNAPPPMDFKAILAIAEKKSKEPSNSTALLTIPKKKKEDERRPMTQEEKDRMERRKTKEYQDWLKFGGKQPKDNRRSSISDDEIGEKRSLPSQGSNFGPKSVDSLKAKFVGSSSTTSHSREKSTGVKPLVKQSSHYRSIPVNENLLVCGPVSEDNDDDKSDNDIEAVQGNPFDRIMKQVHKKRPASQHMVKPSKRMRIDSEEEEEEDSDMDDFIDDGDDPALDVSKEIQSLFGYNRNKYKNEREDDLSDMEANFSTVMAEEKRSAKLGLLEDLEDIRMEQEELRRKAALKKKMRRAK